MEGWKEETGKKENLARTEKNMRRKGVQYGEWRQKKRGGEYGGMKGRQQVWEGEE